MTPAAPRSRSPTATCSHVGGGTSVQFVSLNAQQGSDDSVSAISLKEGSVVLSVARLRRQGRSAHRHRRPDRLRQSGSARARQRGLRGAARPSSCARDRSRCAARPGPTRCAPATTCSRRARRSPRSRAAASRATGSTSGRPTDSRRRTTRRRTRRASTSARTTPATSPRSTATATGTTTPTYSSYVWRPNVGAGWTPYSNGSWYYTPAGLTWWSYDPWGWYPFHYGNWFFDTGWNSWCWSPGYVYSPAWVYWGYTSGYVGWCPLGWYGFYSPWWNTYYRQWSYPRGVRLRDQRHLLDAPGGLARLELHRRRTASERRAAAWTSSPARAWRIASAARSPSRRGRSSCRLATASACATRCGTTSATRRARSIAPRTARPSRASSPSSPATASLPQLERGRPARPRRRRGSRRACADPERPTSRRAGPRSSSAAAAPGR